MEAALSQANKLEAYEQSLACQGTLVDHDDGRAKHCPRTVCAVAESSDASKTAALHKCMHKLQEALAQATTEIAVLAAGPWSGQAALLDPLSALLRMPVRHYQHQLQEIWPNLIKPAINVVVAGVNTDSVSVSQIYVKSASSWDTWPAIVTNARSQPLRVLCHICVCHHQSQW